MRRLEHFRDVGKGDVLLVAQPFTPKGKDLPVLWRWFGVVYALGKEASNLRVRRCGAPPGAKPHTFVRGDFLRRGLEIHFLDPDEWPDGVHVLRTQMILRREIDLD